MKSIKTGAIIAFASVVMILLVGAIVSIVGNYSFKTAGLWVSLFFLTISLGVISLGKLWGNLGSWFVLFFIGGFTILFMESRRRYVVSEGVQSLDFHATFIPWGTVVMGLAIFIGVFVGILWITHAVIFKEKPTAKKAKRKPRKKAVKK